MIATIPPPGPAGRVGDVVAWVFIIGAVPIAVTAVWKVVVPVVRMANRFLTTWPIIEDIAEAFRPDGGPSLFEQLHKISADQDAHGGQIAKLDIEMRGVRHDVIGVKKLGPLSTALNTVPTLTDVLGAVVDELKAIRDASPAPPPPPRRPSRAKPKGTA